MRVFSMVAAVLLVGGCTPVDFATECSVAPERCCELNPAQPACADAAHEATVDGEADASSPTDTSPVDDSGGSFDSASALDTETTDVVPDSLVPDGAMDSGVDSAALDGVALDGVADGDSCARNACGGCAPLTKPLGGACGVCNAGKYVCSGVDDVACADPFGGPKPGATCGTCGSLVTKCSPDGKSAICPGSDANACGGCAMLTNAPGGACGACGGGSYVCDGTNATRCSDPVATAPGTKCGTCMTSSFVCSGTTTTVCAKPDDRTSGTEAFWVGNPHQVGDANDDDPGGIAFTMQHPGSITELTLTIQRTFVASVAEGSLRVRVIKGDPTPTPAAADVLATVNLPALTFPEFGTTPTPRLVALTPTASLAVGQRVWIELTDQSPAWGFEILGTSGASGPSHLGIFWKDGAVWKQLADQTPYLKVTVNGCGW